MTVAALSGFITVLGTALTPLAGPSSGAGTYILQANPANSGTYCYVGRDANDTVTSTTCFSLSKSIGNQLRITLGVDGLSSLWFSSDTANDDVMWMKVAGEGSGVAVI